jgi:hypothetical protein
MIKNNNFNYEEHIFVPPSLLQKKDEEKQEDVITFDVPESNFQEKRSKVACKKKYSFFEKSWTRYQYMDIYYEFDDQMKVRTYRMTPIDLVAENNGVFHVCKYQKDKIPYHMFPSTRSLSQVTSHQATFFRIDGNVSLVFETQMNKRMKLAEEGEEEKLVHKIYIQVNKEKDSDSSDSSLRACQDAKRLVQ